MDYFDAQPPTRIEWIDDDSANIVYDDSETALQALIAFAAVQANNVTSAQQLQLLPAKSISTKPTAKLQVRLAVLGDKKMAGARDRSRFYLWNPEYERPRREGRGGPRYRDRDDGGYRSRRYDDRENRKRGQVDVNQGLDASMYDDDSTALAKRASRRSPRARSPRSESRSDSRPRNRGRDRGARELFPVQDGEKGRLRDRSASPLRENEWESHLDDTQLLERRKNMAAIANREKAQLLKAKRVQEVETSKELFPNKVGSAQGRRQNISDVTDETADLFSGRMAVPFANDGSTSRTLLSRSTNRNPTMKGASTFSIRGAAKTSQAPIFSIKGASGNVKELFPISAADNAGRELFSEGNNRGRKAAGDLFD